MTPEQIAILNRAAADDAYRLMLTYIEAGFRRKEAVQIVTQVISVVKVESQEETK